MKKLIEKATWLLTAFGALNWGLFALKMNVFRYLPYVLTPIIIPFYLIIGAAGVYSLLMFFVPGFCSTCKK